MSKESLSGIGLGTVVLAVLVTLKLTGQITLSWVWVLLPLWLPFAFFIIILLVIGLITIYTMLNNRN